MTAFATDSKAQREKLVVALLETDIPGADRAIWSAAHQVHLHAQAYALEESEQRADRLALELLAPAHAATACLRGVLGDAEDLSGEEECAAVHLVKLFGLPADVASSYVRLLFGGRRLRLSLSEEIFGSK